MKINAIVASLLFVLVTISTHAQFSPDSVFRKNDLIKDIYSLKKTIVDSHPNPYAFCTKEEFTEAFGKALEKIDKDLPLKDYVRIVEQAMVVMRDSHSGVDYSNVQKMQIENGNAFLPFRVVSYLSEIYVESDRDSILPKGAKVLCIENKDARSLYLPAIYYAHIEGLALTGQRRIADALFPYVLGLYQDLSDTITVDVEPFGKDTILSFRLPLYTKAQWDARMRKNRASEFERMLKLSYYNHDSIAVLKVGTFAPSNKKQYQKIIKEYFKEIKEKDVQLLALDLRDNGGGQSSNVEFLYSFIEKEGYNTPANIIGKSSELAQSRAKAQKGKFTMWVLRNLYKKNEDVQGFVTLQELPKGEMDTIYFYNPVKQSEKLVYTGKAVLFINGLTASASVDFTNAFLSRARGEVLGEACLGPNTGTFGNPTIYTLPITQLKVSISTIRYNYDNSFIYSEKALKPTIEIPLLPQHLASETDPCLDYTIHKIFPIK